MSRSLFWWQDLRRRAHEWIEDRLPMPLKRVWCALGFWTPIDVLRYGNQREGCIGWKLAWILSGLMHGGRR